MSDKEAYARHADKPSQRTGIVEHWRQRRSEAKARRVGSSLFAREGFRPG
jgi:hypothetical protein